MGLSEYEQKRADKVAANQRRLEELGLGGPSLLSACKSKRAASKRKLPSKPSSAPSRKSPRGGAPAKPAKPASLVDFSRWVVAFFNTLLEKTAGRPPAPSSGDARRCHQHLSISPDGRSVATTGLAGFGVALCRLDGVGLLVADAPLAAKKPKSSEGRRWSVRVARLGVGGFGVGVVKGGMKPPYKSIGKSAAAVGAYHNSGRWTGQGADLDFGRPYGEGDVIDVVLRPGAGGKGGREVAFCLNGEEVGCVGVPPHLTTGSQDLLLAVQPYMGGVATLC